MTTDFQKVITLYESIATSLIEDYLEGKFPIEERDAYAELLYRDQYDAIERMQNNVVKAVELGVDLARPSGEILMTLEQATMLFKRIDEDGRDFDRCWLDMRLAYENNRSLFDDMISQIDLSEIKSKITMH